MPTLPFKLNHNPRPLIPKQKHKVANWAEYDASPRQRGSVTVWFTDEAIAAWHAEPRTTPQTPASEEAMNTRHNWMMSRRGFCLCCVSAPAAASGVWLTPRQAFAEALGIVERIKSAAATT